jgi:hypothetical protein
MVERKLDSLITNGHGHLRMVMGVGGSVQPAKNLDNCIGESGKESISWMPRQTWPDPGNPK